ncbi:MAG: DNA adenine methylase [Pseudomonadota bacterium]
MSKSFSPLRYPGGKSSLLPVMASILKSNDLERRPYAEPFAGGCGLALGLLYGGYVSEIHLNDIDPSIWSFWHSVLERTEELIERVATTPITIDEWRYQRDIYLAGDLSDPVSLGFAAFFLNRTNRSGIIKGAGVIGGLSQTGNYKIDCRFNREDLIQRITRVQKYKRRIHLYRQDAVEFLRFADCELPEQSLLCIDPPYYNKGSSLYTSFYTADDHAALSEMILTLTRPWLVTYDDVPEIRALYEHRPQHRLSVKYSVQVKRTAGELLVSSADLELPEGLERLATA